eukprot:gnl/TRDRNA2_/TRDRNA2_201242_c0_seq1.p1 gnl/TRDRNA2_/TRDRNA2_201242_c0~~gnl/TRDRNA2_/TRDRNA2_201242_c0_seq1.p1  ORF type:complete len:329 (+),score=63.57 gnl/TRDRNA2_/TRDRNA2_201242_c0_seq1:49-1035(+)
MAMDHQPAEGVQELKGQLGDSRIEVWTRAAEELKSLGTEGAAALASLLRHQDERVRTRAMLTLGRMGEAAAGYAEVIALSLEDEDPGVRRTAVEVLASLASGVAAEQAGKLTRSLHDDCEAIRTKAAGALLALGTVAAPHAVDLAAGLRDPSTEVWIVTAEALQRLGDAGVAALVALHADIKTDACVRRRVKLVLSRMTGAVAEQALRDLERPPVSPRVSSSAPATATQRPSLSTKGAAAKPDCETELDHERGSLGPSESQPAGTQSRDPNLIRGETPDMYGDQMLLDRSLTASPDELLEAPAERSRDFIRSGSKVSIGNVSYVRLAE